MRKITNYLLRTILIVSLLATLIVYPMDASAATKAKTLRELRTQLSELQAKKKANANKKALTQNEIKSKNAAIDKAYSDIEASENKITEAKGLIEESNKRIEELKEKNEELMAYFQLMQGDNAYLEFITDSSSMTELIMRNDAVNQLAQYQQEKLNELSELIKKNEQLQVDLKKYEVELENNITSYKSKINSLEDDLSSLNEIGMSIDDEIRSQQELIKAYEQMGCKEDQDLDVCAAVAGNVQWLKPLAKGRINSIYGTRIDPFTGKPKVHKAVDIGGNAEGTKVYSVGNGIVIGTVDAKATYNKKGTKTCGGNQVYIQLNVKGQNYVVQYAHLLQVNVKVGDKVTGSTVIGLQGGGSGTKKWERCSTGTHLHFGVAKGAPSKNQTATGFFYANVMKPPGFPSKGAWFYSRTQWFG